MQFNYFAKPLPFQFPTKVQLSPDKSPKVNIRYEYNYCNNIESSSANAVDNKLTLISANICMKINIPSSRSSPPL